MPSEPFNGPAGDSGRDVTPINAQISEVLGPPALYEGETAAAFNQLYDRLLHSASPTDAIGGILLRDVAELSLEIFRLRRQKAKLMVSSKSMGLYRILDAIFVESDGEANGGDSLNSEDGAGDGSYDDVENHDEDDDDEPFDDEEYQTNREIQLNELHSRWRAGDADAGQEVERLLQLAGYDWHVVEAEALRARFDDFERFDRMIAQAEARRNGILREIDRHNDIVARRMRDAIADVEDAEFEDVIPGSEAAE